MSRNETVPFVHPIRLLLRGLRAPQEQRRSRILHRLYKFMYHLLSFPCSSLSSTDRDNQWCPFSDPKGQGQEYSPSSELLSSSESSWPPPYGDGVQVGALDAEDAEDVQV